ncbi:MAG: RluA family pseudouridine synthase, partial [bacterium]|nr:RluA family pseudouridine synthase [bacterium]
MEYKIPSKYDGCSIQAVLIQEFKMSHQLLIRLKRSGTVLKNGVPCWLREKVQPEDALIIIIREELTQDIGAENIPLEIIFEDEHLLVINKSPGIVVHPTKGYKSGTIANAVIYYWRECEKNYVFRPVHRLDKDTSGVLVIAKNPYVQDLLTAQQASGQWKKYYLAVVSGEILLSAG